MSSPNVRVPLLNRIHPRWTPARLSSSLAWFDWEKNVDAAARTWSDRVAGNVLAAASGQMPSVSDGLLFDGIIDCMAGASSLAAQLGGTNAFTVVCSIDRASETVWNAIWGLTDGANVATSFLSHRMVSPGSGSNDYWIRGSSGAIQGTEGDGGGPAVITAAFTGSAVIGRVNGSPSLSGASSNNLSTADTVVVGVSDYGGTRNTYFGGKVFDLFFAAGVLPDSVIERVEAYFVDKQP